MVTKLNEGTEYEFRVMAENANGLSAPLETEKPIKAKNPYGMWLLLHVLVFMRSQIHLPYI